MQANLNSNTAGGLEDILLAAAGAAVTTTQAQNGTAANVSQISTANKTGLAAVPVWAWWAGGIAVTLMVTVALKKAFVD